MRTARGKKKKNKSIRGGRLRATRGEGPPTKNSGVPVHTSKDNGPVRPRPEEKQPVVDIQGLVCKKTPREGIRSTAAKGVYGSAPASVTD